MELMQLWALAKKQHAWVESMRWHNKTPLESLALIASEVGEAVNECRGEHPTDSFGEELADILLRVVDTAEEFGVDIQTAVIEKMKKNAALSLCPKGRIK